MSEGDYREVVLVQWLQLCLSVSSNQAEVFHFSDTEDQVDKDQEIAHETREKEEVGLRVLPKKVLVTRVHVIAWKIYSLVHVAAGVECITPRLCS